MKRIRLYVIIMVCLLLTSAFSGCKPGGPEPLSGNAGTDGMVFSESTPIVSTNASTAPNITTPNVTEPDITEPILLQDDPIQLSIPSLFKEETIPVDIDTHSKECLIAEANRLLAKKQYSEAGNQLILYSIDHLCTYYPNFQTLFQFLGAPNITEYIHNTLLGPLEDQVDYICYPCTHEQLQTLHPASSETMFNTRTIHIHQNSNDSASVADLLSILCDMRAYSIQSDVNLRMLRSYEQITRLTLIGSEAYHNLSALDPFNYNEQYNVRYANPNERDHFLQYGKFVAYMSGDAVQPDEWLTSVYFKLYALTDYHTFEQFLQPDGSLTIRETMVQRYGDEGALLYDQLSTLYTTSSFEQALETEKLFLKLFLSRLDEVETSEDMTSYMHLYRIYRKLFCANYLRQGDPDQFPFTQTLFVEADHPELDYRSADLTIAQAIINHHLINSNELTPELQLMMAYGLITPRKAIDASNDLWNTNYTNQEPYLMRCPSANIIELPNGDFYAEILYNNGMISNFYYTAEETLIFNP